MSDRLRRVRSWGVWALRGRLLALLLTVELVDIALLAMGVVTTPWTVLLGALPTAGALLAAGVAHIEVAQRVERARRRAVGTHSAAVDAVSVWTFAAALLLSNVAASFVIAALYAYIYWRIDRFVRKPMFQRVYQVATVVLAAHGAGLVLVLTGGSIEGVMRGPAGPLVIAVAALVYTLINMSLVVGAVVLKSRRRVREVISGGGDVFMEVATLSLGALLAMVITAAGAYVVAIVLAPLLVLHRALLTRYLERVEKTDPLTGLLNAAGWQSKAMTHLRRLRRGSSAGVLLLDVDDFGAINELNGRPAGDQVLVALAEAIVAEVGDGGVVGRLNGGEFAVLLPRPRQRLTAGELAVIAGLLQTRVQQLQVEIATPSPDGPRTVDSITVSIGGAIFPQHASRWDILINRASEQVREAKKAGTNLIRIRANEHDLAGADPVDPPVLRSRPRW